jgi:hypothetical protein
VTMGLVAVLKCAAPSQSVATAATAAPTHARPD